MRAQHADLMAELINAKADYNDDIEAAVCKKAVSKASRPPKTW
jgi:hypothetical protein